MAFAPLSQTLLLTEDGTALDVGSPVTIPPRPVVPAPSFTLPASIGSDGTPQVGERLVGDPGEPVDGVIIAIAWLRAGTVLSEEIAYTPLQIGDLDFRSTASGPGGTTTSTATVTVAPASVTPPTPISISGTPPMAGVVGEAYSFIPNVSGGSGPRTFALASGVLLGGMSFSTTSGRITGEPNVAGTISDLAVRVTDSTGSDETDPVDVTIAAAPVTNTLDNTNGTSTVPGTSVANYGPGYADQLRSIAAQKGFTLTTPNSAPVADFVVEEVEAILDAAEEAPTPAPTIMFSMATGTVPEGGTITSVITIDRDGLTGDVVVNLAASGTATSGVDYVALPASVTIPAGADMVNFSLSTTDDALDEPDETVIITGTVQGYPAATATRTITIVDNDEPAPPAGLTDHGTTNYVAPYSLANRPVRFEYDIPAASAGDICLQQILRGSSADFFYLYTLVRQADGNAGAYLQLRRPGEGVTYCFGLGSRTLPAGAFKLVFTTDSTNAILMHAGGTQIDGISDGDQSILFNNGGAPVFGDFFGAVVTGLDISSLTPNGMQLPIKSGNPA